MDAGPPPPGPREIFSYHDGKTARYADPHAVQRILHSRLGGSLAEVIRQANNKEGDVAPQAWSQAWEQLYAAGVAAFGLQPFDPTTGEGVTETDCAGIISRFFLWQTDLLKKKDSRLTSQAPTVPRSSIRPSITKPSTPSGSA